MTTSKRLLVLTTLFAASIAIAAPDGIVLRKTLKAGTENYHMVSSSLQTITMPGGTGEQQLGSTSTSSYSLNIIAVDLVGSSAPVELTTKLEKLDFTGPLADLLASSKDKLLKPSTIKGTLDSRNRFAGDPNGKVDLMSILNGSTTNSLAGLFIEFPEAPVNVGDSWDVTIKKGPLAGKEDQKLTAKLVSDSQVDGKGVYTVSLIGSIKTDIDLGQLAKNSNAADLGPFGSLDAQVKGKVDFNAQATVDKATGSTLVMTIKLTTKQEVIIANTPSIPLTGTSTSTLTLDK